MKEKLFSKRFYFYQDEEVLPGHKTPQQKMADKLTAFEELNMDYDLRRSVESATGTIVWSVDFYK